jgi:ABC-type multidrug transport system fused ATPase/permease subunit
MDNITKQTLVLFWQVISKDKKDLYKSLFFPLSLLFTGVIIPYIVSMLLANIITKQTLDAGLLAILISSIIIGVTTNFLGFTAYCALQAKSYQELMVITMKSLLKRSTGFHADNVSGNTVNNAINLGTALDDFLTGLYTQALGIIITVTVGISLILYKSWELGLALIILVIIKTL